MTIKSASCIGDNATQVGMDGTKRMLMGLALALAVIFVRHDTAAVQPMIPLGSAAKFAVLAATTVTSSGATTVNGNLGVSPGTTVTGSPTVNGTTHLGDPTAAQAQGDLTIAYNNAAGRLGGAAVSGNLGGLTLIPGLYTSTSSLEITSGDLTLDAQGDANAVFIFQMPSTFITTVGRKVILSGGATACHVFWQGVGSKTGIVFVLGAGLAGVLAGCIGYVDGPRQERVYAQHPPAYVETALFVQDDYMYYPDYQVYYSGRRHQYVYLEGRSWVSRPAPPRVSAGVVFASPSVSMDFHDAPAAHHATIVRTYPKNWTPPGWSHGNKGGNKEGHKEGHKKDKKEGN